MANTLAHNFETKKFCTWYRMKPYIGDRLTKLNGTTNAFGSEYIDLPDRGGAASAPIGYCLSEGQLPVGQGCNVEFSAVVMGLVCIFNLVKVACISAMIFWMKQDSMVNLGDAISSFFERPDESTEDKCLLDLQAVRRQQLKAGARSWVPQRPRLFVVGRRRRWILTLVP